MTARPPVAIDNVSIAATDFRVALGGLLTPRAQLRTRGGALGAPVVVTAKATPAMTVTLPPCVIVVDNDAFAGGPALLANDAPLDLAITAASGTNPRVDLVVARWVDETAGSGRGGFFSVVTGTPATTPVAPAMPANSFLVTTIQVPKSATGIRTQDITNSLVTTCTVGGIAVSLSNGDVAPFYDGQYRDIGGALQRSNGTAWKAPKLFGELPTTAIPLSAGWSSPAGGAAEAPPTFETLHTGRTFLDGFVLDDIAYQPGPTKVIGVLPPGARPSKTKTFPQMVLFGPGFVHIDIRNTGEIVAVRCPGLGTGVNIDANTLHSLSGINFSND